MFFRFLKVYSLRNIFFADQFCFDRNLNEITQLPEQVVRVATQSAVLAPLHFKAFLSFKYKLWQVIELQIPLTILWLGEKLIV